MLKKVTLDILQSDIQFVRKMLETVQQWRNTNLVQKGGYGLDDPLHDVEVMIKATLDKLYRQYGETVFPK